jgi:group I intron endonuclease
MINIYKITNKVDGKIYIGRTKHNIAERFKQHVRESKQSVSSFSYFKRAIRKYGVENFVVELIEQCNPDVAHEREEYNIKLFNSIDEKIGYNSRWKSVGNIREVQESTRILLRNTARNYWNKLSPEKRTVELSRRWKGVAKPEHMKLLYSKWMRGRKSPGGKSEFRGVGFSRKIPQCTFYYPMGVLTITTETELQAAKLWDSLSYMIYGMEEKFNFPDEVVKYSTSELIDLLLKLCKVPMTKYKRITIRNRPKKYAVQYVIDTTTGRRIRKEFNSEQEAVSFLCEKIGISEEELLRPPTGAELFFEFLRSVKLPILAEHKS